MNVSPEERRAITEVLEYGERYGYGNLISHLRTRWARSLVNNHGMDEETARHGAHGGNHMPFRMQDDILEFGFWDETGERYKET